ncbi:alpha-amylase family glycosyl hydrolase [Alkalihalobacillus sp. LMS6]|uniref:alpha-amylase family glycosyl hydrolase n=2 Tax=Bacillaceae TaxID=186817 RepID=UPI0020D0C538|nr:alpha-amylase family glycosyl hydrolase [Alkalihalobacillus sp. LMS6]UTR08279.1 alpha-amylase family glycosyl hydrolase [Alkalihalobacillus sp. LMS6]
MKGSTMIIRVASISFLFFFLLSSPKIVQADVTNKVNYSQDVIYQIVTDRFSDGNPANNPSGAIFSQTCSDLHKYCGGDWQGIINKMNDGYLTELGITAIWISQPVENVHALHPSGYTSYHGYWARDYKKTNPYYGSFADFDRLIQTAHSKGIKIIMDFTPNHSSPALETNPSYAENGAIYNNGVRLGTYSNDPNTLFHHNGGTDFSSYEDSIYRNLYDLADYNLNNNVMDQYLKESIKLWLDEGIDGIRVDAVKHMSEGWQTSLMSDIYTHKPVFTFGEWFLGAGEVDPQNHQFANESGMSLLDFRFGQTIRSVLKDRSSNWYDFHAMIESTENDYNEVIDQVTFIDNHDMSRFTVDQSKRQTDLALAVMLTSRGVPTIYYGTEQYLTGGNDPENRKPMKTFDRSTNSYQLIKKLASLRQTNPALGYGETTERWINADVYIYERTFGNHVVLTAVNSSSKNYSINSLNTSLPQGNYADELQQRLDGHSISVQANGSVNAFQLRPNSVSVWQVTKPISSPLIGHVGPMMGKSGNTVTISGEGFGDKKGSVLFGSSSSEVVSWSNTKIEVKVPNVTAGYVDLSVVSATNKKSPVYSKFEVLTGDQVSVRFAVNSATTNAGTNLYIVGNVSELGNWDPNKAIGPMFNQVIYKYPTWYYDISVPAGKKVEYKYIKKDQNGNVVWQSGNNRSYTTPNSGTDTVRTDW